MIEKNKKGNETLIDSNVENSIKKDNKKSGMLFIVIMVVCGIFGGILGMIFAMARKSIPEMQAAFEEFMTANIITFAVVIPLVMILMILFAAVWSIRNIKITKNSASGFIERDDEESLRRIDKKLSYNLWILNGIGIIFYFLFAVMMFADIKFGLKQVPKISIYTVVVFLAAILIIIKLQQKLVDCTRIINPEKKGSVYDLNFAKKWEESCDEAEKLTIYRAAYKAYQRVNILCIVLWAFFVILGIFSGIGFLPVVTVIIIWTVLSCTYNYYAIKYSE